MERDHDIREVARLAGVTSRTLRHYDDVGLLPPSSVGAGGVRRYDADALVRLQRILLLRDLGLGIPAIAEVLDGQRDDAGALRTHLGWLRREHERLDRQIASVEDTITRLEGGEPLMADRMFEGFDHTRYEAEVSERWGADAYEQGDRWWRGMSDDERAAWQARVARLGADWAEAAERGEDPAGPAAQRLARRHAEWLAGVPGTPAHRGGEELLEYLSGLGELYVADARFGANYGGGSGAAFVRDALAAYVAAARGE